jgi:two-component system chemotaxis response regulator CheY
MRMIVRRTLRQAGFDVGDVTEHAGDDRHRAAVGAPRRGAELSFGFVTSESTPEMRKRALDAGALFLVGKPFTVEALQETLAPVVGAVT